MSNQQIKEALEQQRNELYHSLSGQTLSALFKQEYRDLKDGSGIQLGDDGDVLKELKQLSKDTSHDKLFKQKVQSASELDSNDMITGFEGDITQLLDLIEEKGIETEVQAVFIEYDSYYDNAASATGYGKQNYPVVTQPRYLSSEIDFSNVVFQQVEAINFEKAWLDCEDFEWTTEHLDVYYQLQNLYQLNSRLLLHQAIQKCFENGQLDILKVRPFTFYINEHDSEVMTLFRID